MCTKIIRFEARKWVVAHSVTDFVGKPFWCHRFIKRYDLSMPAGTRVAQKMPTKYETKIARKKSCFELGQIVSMGEVPVTSVFHQAELWTLRR
jgi:hypothetical protein